MDVERQQTVNVALPIPEKARVVGFAAVVLYFDESGQNAIQRVFQQEEGAEVTSLIGACESLKLAVAKAYGMV